MSACTMNITPFPEFDLSAATSALGVTFASPMQEFIEMAAKLAKLDETVNQLKAQAPNADGTQANMWFEVSMRSMTMTRTIYAQKQADAMKKLTFAAAAQRGDQVTATMPQEDAECRHQGAAMVPQADPGTTLEEEPVFHAEHDSDSDVDSDDEDAELELQEATRSIQQELRAARDAAIEQPEPELTVIAAEAQPEPEPEEEEEEEA